MNYIGKFISNFKDFYNEINAATLTGAIDVVVVRQEDGSYLSSPFHVRFGKMGVLRSREKVVDIEINGEPVDIHMKLGETGEAFFVQELDDEVDGETNIDQNYAKSDEEARSQDSGFEAEDNIPEPQPPPPQTLTLRLKTDDHGDVDPLQEDEAEARLPVAEHFPEISNATASVPTGTADASTTTTVAASTTTTVAASTTTTVAASTTTTVAASSGDQVTISIFTTEDESKSNNNKSDAEVRSTQSSELGVISRVPRQDSSKFIMKHICTQTECDEFELVPVTSEDANKKTPPKPAHLEKLSSSQADPAAKQKNGKKGSSEGNKNGGAKNDADAKSKEDADDGSKGSRNQRRKRRRRQNYKQQQQQQQQLPGGTNKKKSGSGSQSSDASTTSEVADLSSVSTSSAVKDDGGVFAMDDVDAKDGVAHSTSLPLLRESPTAAPLPTSLSAGLVDTLKPWVDQEARPTTPMRKISCVDLGPNFHPFSDTDISPPPSPGNSRPSTPIKSDTEYEVERHRQERNDQCAKGASNDNWNWTWGQLPTPPAKPQPKSGASTSNSTTSTSATSSPTTLTSASSGSGGTAVEQRSDAGAATADPASCDHPDPGGASMQSSAQLASASQPDEADRSMFGGMLSFMRATKKARHNPQSEGIYLEDLNPNDLDPEVAALYFPKFNPSAGGASTAGVPIPGCGDRREDDAESGNGPSLPHSPHSAGDPRLLGLDSEGEQETAPGHPIFKYKEYEDVALSLCGRLQELRSKEVPESLFQQSLVTYDDFCCNPAALLENPELVVRIGGTYYNWITAAPHLLSLVLFQRPLPLVLSDELILAHMPKKELRKRSPSMGLSWFGWRRAAPDSEEGASSAATPDDQKPSEEDTVEVTAAETQTSAPGSPEKDSFKTSNPPAGDDKEDHTPKHSRNYKKSLRLTSEQIEQLKLHDGSNEVMFSVTTAYQGTTRCKCRIYLWNYDEKIIVSDIDGTITKSDVLGHILPIIGRDWAQGGVAQLFSKIKDNGYHFLYLSARAIGQARITRDYLESVVQEDVTLPDGPLLLNPTSLLQAFHREVIERKPEEFKISCLRDIQALFPNTGNPFYAGYGNRVNDVWAYCAVGIPISRVFTINHKGELKHELTQTFQSTYSNLSDIVHHMFPVYCQDTLHHGEYSSVRYWRQPLPDCHDEINKLLYGQSPASTQA